jgi:hypothetical protein
MDYTFAQAMDRMALFHPLWEVAVFQGKVLRGVLSVAAPDVCIHGDAFDDRQPVVTVYQSGSAMAAFDCGCAYLGRFRSSAPV